jgi:thioesterase domain-containing protein
MSSNTGADQLAEYTGLLASQVPILGAMGVTLVKMEPGVAVVEAPQEPNVNHAGMFYAGSLFSLAEVLGGLLPLVTWEMPGYVPIVADVQIRFRKPALGTIRASVELSEDEVARVRSEIAEGAKKVWFTLEASLTDGAGVEVASTVGKYVLLAM